MPTLYRGAAARRFTVMTFIVALVLSMLTLFTAPSAYAQSGLPAAPVADTHLDDVPAPPAHAEGNSEDSEGSPRDQQLMNGAPSHPGSQEPADGSTEPDTEHQPAELPAAAKLSGDESGVISGHITLPQEASGAESAWYESLTITAYNDDFGSVVGTVESTGEYSVTGLDAGAYWLRVENHSWSEPTDPDFVNLPRTIFWDGVGTDYVSEPIEVAADSPTVRDMTLPLGRSLSGSVTLSPGADPAWLAGVEIYVNLVTGSGDDRAHHHLDTLCVEEDGSYRIDRLAPGLYTLYLQPEEGDPLTGRYFPGDPGDLEAPLIDLTLGDAVLETVQLERTRVISGTLVPPPGIPASWWDSVMVSTESGSSVQPDENGYFVIDGLEPGKHRLRVTSNSFDINVVSRYFPGNTKAESDAGTYDLTEEAALDVGELELTAGAVLSGRIEIPSNAPQAWLSQIGVRALPETYKPGNADWVPIGTVDPETGEYTIRGMDDGAYSVQFSPTRWGDEGQDLPNLQGRYLGDTTIFEDARWVSATVGETVTGLDQSLPFGAVLSGTVTLPPGVDAAQLEAVTVQAMRDSETDDFAPHPQSVDVTSGSYTIVGLPVTVCAVWRINCRVRWRIHAPITRVLAAASMTSSVMVSRSLILSTRPI